jgi:hypothetical protein
MVYGSILKYQVSIIICKKFVNEGNIAKNTLISLHGIV